MNQVVIRIIDTDNNVLGDLDLTNFTDFPLVITKGIVNLDNLKTRTGTYTKTFKVPNTKNNSKLLSNVDNINARKDYRDSLNRKPCVILVNGAETERGFVQVSKVMNGFELDSFELVFFGNNIDWVKQASELKINEINFSNNTQTVSEANIDIFNAGDSDTYDVAFPYISRGGNQSTPDSTVNDYYPVFYLRRILETGLNQLGWNVNSNFLLDTDVKRLVCDFPLDFVVTEADVEATRVRASKTNANQTVTYLNEVKVQFNDDSTTPNKDSGGNYNNTTYEYNVPTTAKYNISFTFGATNVVGTGDLSGCTVKLVRVSNGAVLASEEVNGGATNTRSVDFNNVFLSAGWDIAIYVLADFTGSSAISYEDFEIIGNDPNNPTYFSIQRKAELEDGDIYLLQDVIPDDIHFLDVINDFTRMFNIYYWSDIKSKTVYFEPRDTFFKASTEAINWSDKLDLNNKYEVDYVSSYKRSVKFGYKDLSDDVWLKEWQNKNKRKYGEYTHTLPDRFGEGTTEIKLDLFSASYGIQADEVTPITNGTYVDDEKPITIRLWNQKENTPQPEERISNYNSRIYLFNNGTQTSAGGTSRRINKFGGNTTTIPYGIFETYSNVDSDINLSFTSGELSNGDPSKGLFETYYSNMLKNIEEGGRLVAYFNLSNVDIENLDFRKLVYIEYPAQVKGYYLIESVIDFNPIVNGLTKVSLFKFENLGSVPIDSGQGGNNNSNIDDGNTTPTLEPIYVQDGSNLVEVWIENPVTGLLEPVYR